MILFSGDIWRCLGTLPITAVRGGAGDIYRAEAGDAVHHPVIHRTAPTTKDAPHVSPVQAEGLCCSLTPIPILGMCGQPLLGRNLLSF